MKKIFLVLLFSGLFFLEFHSIPVVGDYQSRGMIYRSGLKISEARHSRRSGNLFKSTENLNTISIAATTANAKDPEKPECTEELAKEAERATTAMDMTDYALLNQTMSTAKEAASAGGSTAKKYYEVDGLGKGTLSTITARKYARCKAAIKKCESICTDAITEQSLQAKEQIKFEGYLKRCIAQEETCNQNALQSLMSGLQAATSLLGAKALEGGDSKEKKDPDHDPRLPQIPNLPPLAQFPGINSDCPGCFEDSEDGEEALIPPGGGEKTVVTDGKGNQETAKKGGPDTGTTDSLTGPLFSPSGSPGSSGSNSPNALHAGSAGDGNALAPDFIGDEEWEDEEEGEDQAKGKKYAAGPTSAFGGSSRTPGKWGDGSSRARGKKRGLSALKKKSPKESKRNVFSKSNVQDSIFKKMSRLIQSYCNTGREQC